MIALFNLWIESGMKNSDMALLSDAVQDDTSLAEKLKMMLEKYTTPIQFEKNAEFERKERNDLRRQYISEKREKKCLEKYSEWRKRLISDPSSVSTRLGAYKGGIAKRIPPSAKVCDAAQLTLRII